MSQKNQSEPNVPRWRWSRLAISALLCLVMASCGLCERVEDNKDATLSAANFAKVVPADADLAVFAGDWKHLRDVLGAAQRRVGTQLPIEAGMAELKRALGVDLNDIKDIESKGIQTNRGLALVLIDGEFAFLFSSANNTLFEALLQGVASQRWNGAATPIEKTIANKPAKMILAKSAKADQGQTPPLTAENVIFAWHIEKNGTVALVPGKSLIGNTKDPEITLSKLLSTQESNSLAKHADYEKLTTLVGKQYPIFGVYDLAGTFKREAARTSDQNEAEDLKHTAERFSRVGLGLSIDDEKATLHALALTKPEVLAQLQKTSSALGDFKLQGALTDGSPILFKLAVEPTLILDELANSMNSSDRKGLEGWLDMLKTSRGIDIKGALMPTLDGNVVATINDIDQKVIANILLGGGMMRLMPDLNAVIALGVKDRDGVLKVLNQAKDGSLGFLSHSNENGLDLFKLRLPGSSTDGNPMLTLAVGPAQLVLLTRQVDQKTGLALARLESKTQPASLSLGPVNQLLTNRKMSGLVIDVALLADKISALGDQRAGRLTTVLAPFKAWLLTSTIDDNGVVLDLNLIFKPAGGSNAGQTP